MKRNSLIWGSLIVLIGLVLLATNLGIVTTAIWRFLWPVALLLLGMWFILGPVLGRGEMETTSASVPVENTTTAEVEFNFGAGVLNVTASANPQELAGGTFTGGVTTRVSHEGSDTRLKLNAPKSKWTPGFFMTGQRFDWNVGLTRDLPLRLRFHTGACETKLDLRDLKVTELVLETGASSTEIGLPARAGMTKVSIKSGAASVKVKVPEGVAASIHESSGLSGIDVDTKRFIQNGHSYQSSDYATAENKVEINFEGGVGSIEIK